MNKFVNQLQEHAFSSCVERLPFPLTGMACDQWQRSRYRPDELGSVAVQLCSGRKKNMVNVRLSLLPLAQNVSILYRAAKTRISPELAQNFRWGGGDQGLFNKHR